MLQLINYSEKSVVIAGDTYEHREEIKSIVPNGGKFSRGLRHPETGLFAGWIFSKKHEQACMDFVNKINKSNIPAQIENPVPEQSKSTEPEKQPEIKQELPELPKPSKTQAKTKQKYSNASFIEGHNGSYTLDIKGFLTYLTKVKPLFQKNLIPSLDNICVKNGLFICSNLEITISLQSNAKDLSGLIPFATIYQIMKNEKEGIALLRTTADGAFINTENSVYNITMDISIEEYPNMPEKSGQYPTVIIETNNLKKMIPFTDNNEIRPLNGVHIGDNYMAASDSHFLIWEKIKYNGHAMVLPKTIGNVLDKNTEIIISYYNNENAQIIEKDYLFIVKVIEGTYPNFMSVVPQNNNITMQTNKTQLIKMLKQAITQANKASHLIEFDINDSLKIKSQDIDFALAYNGQLACEHTGNDITIRFNGNKLLTCLSAIESDTVNFTFNNPLSAVIINNNTLLMPLQIQQ